MSRRVIAVGRTLSGKTEALWRRHLRREPRLLIIDPGEWRKKWRDQPTLYPLPGGRDNVLLAQGADGVHDALLDLAERGITEWTIIADADRDDLIEIQELLIPEGDWENSPVPDMGGMAIFMDEIDVLMPRNDNALSGFNRRGRHVELSVYMATQRPASVNKECTSQVDFYLILALHEPRDVEYLKSVMGEAHHAQAMAHVRSAPYRSALFHPPTGQLWLLGPEPP